MKQIIAAWLNRYFANVEALVLLLLITLVAAGLYLLCLLYTSPSPRDLSTSRMPSSA